MPRYFEGNLSAPDGQLAIVVSRYNDSITRKLLAGAVSTLLEKGVPEGAITVIPDEQEAIDAGLRLGQPGDLLLVFADALTRSWKQVIKFKPDPAAGAPVPADRKAASGPAAAAMATPEDESAPLLGDDHSLQAAGFVRDERGLRFAGEAGD